MIRRRVKPAAYRRAMRERGYTDGRAGKPAAFADACYQASWRRGREARGAELIDVPALVLGETVRSWVDRIREHEVGQ